MRVQKIVTATTVLLICGNGHALPKDVDIEKILYENNILIKGLKKAGIDPLKASKELKDEINKPEKASIGENVPRQCIEKERDLGNGIIKCKNGYFQAN